MRPCEHSLGGLHGLKGLNVPGSATDKFGLLTAIALRLHLNDVQSMANPTPIPRNSSQEIEIDHLLAEEFWCDPDFTARFASAFGMQFDDFKVTRVVPEPRLDEGYGDLLVEAEMNGARPRC